MVAFRSRRVLCDETAPYPTGEDGGPIVLVGSFRRFITRQEARMRLREKGKDEVVHMGWDEAQSALQAGTHEVADAAGSGTETGRAGDGSTEGEGDPDDLDGKTRAELDALAKDRGVDVSAAKTKADVIEALRAAR